MDIHEAVDIRGIETYICLTVTLDEVFERDGQTVTFNVNQVPHFCALLRFALKEDMLFFYKTLRMIQNENIPTPIQTFDKAKLEGEGENKKLVNYHYLALELRSATNLKIFAEQNKEKFFRYRFNRSKYSPSPLYVEIIRGLIMGLWRLQSTSITASLDLAHIYIMKKGQMIGSSLTVKNLDSSVTDDEDMIVDEQVVFGHFMRRGDAKRTKDGDWSALADVVRELNGIVGLTEPMELLDSLIRVLRTSPFQRLHLGRSPRSTTVWDLGSHIQSILRHPVFWKWRQRIMFIVHASDLLKGVHSFTFTNLNLAFNEDWKTSIRNEKDLKLLMAADRTYAAYAANPSTSAIEVGEKTQHVDLSECIHYMRNMYCHFYSLAERSGEMGVLGITSIKELENKFNQLFPNAHIILADKVARYEQFMPYHGGCHHRGCHHGIWPAHI